VRRSSTSAACRRAREERERLADGDLVVKPGLLELHAHVFADQLRLSLRVDAEDADVTAVGVAQARDALDGGGLPGAVGAEDAEDLAGRHDKGDIRHGHLLAIGFPEVLHLDDGIGHRSP
jgi:hypothetical protein